MPDSYILNNDLNYLYTISEDINITGTSLSINQINRNNSTNSYNYFYREENPCACNITLEGYVTTWPSISNFYTDSNYGITHNNINVSGYLSIDSSSSFKYIYTPSSIETKKWEIKKQLTIIVKSRAQEISKIPSNEWTAMQTLRSMITETEYRKYVKDGFISIKGQSGKVYKVSKNSWHTKVFLKGDLIEEICVRLKGDMPPTDNVIAFKTIIETDEEYFASLGNRYNMKKAA